ncbi:alpha/beta hydrolase [Paremcibacter congregatus]|uniref:Alpha/beta hydrolase n=1 Tax=Paremcibacter congregatus TaxID=2043170 RepID=A0A2G4YQW9_9PROT|nr:alpha/beta hydrolase fold domain-containing protein [Paremcibacter congregatus]PHZ84724.1 alpha/beta hydrolase [Paremcibacter congregatus]QDE28919.1 alpha/beta hydrolase [Paremcibacter congregatus]
MTDMKIAESTSEVLTIPSFDLPESELLTEETRKAIADYKSYMVGYMQQCVAALQAGRESGDSSMGVNPRQLERDFFYQGALYRSLTARYSVVVRNEEINGVPVEIFIPHQGVSAENEGRVLINLHGGGFEVGSRTYSQLESIPVSALGNIKVVSPDYRMAPEYRFPAATNDIMAVYRALLEEYQPENIGFYGASAGAILTTQVLVRLQQENLPLPAAIGLIAGGATQVVGDSVAVGGGIMSAIYGVDLSEILKLQYYEGADVDSLELTPSLSDHHLTHFPPAFLASSSRDFALSGVLATHRQLLSLGVEAELHVWEGLEHDFHYNPDLREAEELNNGLLKFFSRYMG